jgi:hypothetical protein
MEMEGGDYTAASALLQQPANTRPSVDAVSSGAGGACESWDAAFGWALVRLYVHLGSLAAAQEALAVCEERDPLRSQGLSFPPSSSTLPPLPRFCRRSCSPSPLSSSPVCLCLLLSLSVVVEVLRNTLLLQPRHISHTFEPPVLPSPC